jgi:hypothetical protein
VSTWNDLDLAVAIHTILDQVQPSQVHPHLGRPYLTPYQIAIELNRSFPHIVRQLNKPLGGRGVERRDSVAQYVALELSRRIRRGELPTIEGALLSDHDVTQVAFSDGIASSATGCYDLSMYRLRTRGD